MGFFIPPRNVRAASRTTLRPVFGQALAAYEDHPVGSQPTFWEVPDVSGFQDIVETWLVCPHFVAVNPLYLTSSTSCSCSSSTPILHLHARHGGAVDCTWWAFWWWWSRWSKSRWLSKPWGWLCLLDDKHPLDSAYSNSFWNKYHGPHTVRETTQLTLDHRLSWC